MDRERRRANPRLGTGSRPCGGGVPESPSYTDALQSPQARSAGEGRAWAPRLQRSGSSSQRWGREGEEPRGEEQNPEAPGTLGRGGAAGARARARGSWSAPSRRSTASACLPCGAGRRAGAEESEGPELQSFLQSCWAACCPCRPRGLGFPRATCVPVAPWILRRRRYPCGSARRRNWCPASPAAPLVRT